jgi:hypothetical protein
MNKEQYKYLNVDTNKIYTKIEFHDDGLNSHYLIYYSLPGENERCIESCSITDLFKQVIAEVAEDVENTVIGQTRTYK